MVSIYTTIYIYTTDQPQDSFNEPIIIVDNAVTSQAGWSVHY